MKIKISNPVTKYILGKIEEVEKKGITVDEILVTKKVYIQLMIEQMEFLRIDKDRKCNFKDIPLIIE